MDACVRNASRTMLGQDGTVDPSARNLATP